MSLPPFQALIDAYGASVYRFLLASVGPAEVDDCFQEACMAALRAYPRVRHSRNLRAWLLTIAERKAIDAQRARMRRPLPVDGVPERADGIASNPPEPLDGQAAVWARVRALPEKQRMAVFLRSVGDLSYDEVARALDCSQDAARRNVHEGLERLRKEWIR